MQQAGVAALNAGFGIRSVTSNKTGTGPPFGKMQKKLAKFRGSSFVVQACSSCKASSYGNLLPKSFMRNAVELTPLKCRNRFRKGPKSLTPLSRYC